MIRKTDRGLIDAWASRPPEIRAFQAPQGWQPDVRPVAEEWRRFDVRAESDNAVITIFDVIGEDPWTGGGVSAKRVNGALRSIGAKPVTVEINSPGGNYFDGVAIYNMLRRHEQAVTVQIMGLAASAASLVAMAGDDIRIARNGNLMIHNAWGLAIGNRHDMAQVSDLLGQLDDAMAQTYAARTGMDAKAIAKMMDEETWIGGQAAVDQNFADGLLEADAEAPVYADAGDGLPLDIGAMDKALAKLGLPRAERRALYQTIKTATPNAGGDRVTPNADADILAGIRRLTETIKP
jgi:ATP-dependent protease ClpP protease subunit